MKIAVQTGGIVDRFGVEAGFRMIREAGFEAVDVNLDHQLTAYQIVNGYVSGGLFDRQMSEIEAVLRPLRDAAAQNGIALTQAHAPFPTRVQNDFVNRYVQSALEKTIALCGYLGCPRLVVHPGFLSYAERGADEWDFNEKMYAALIPALREHGVTCCLENMFTHLGGKVMCGPCASPDEANRWVDALNDRAGERLFGFCLDVGHALLVGRDVKEFIVKLGDRLTCLHLHDNDGATDLHVFPYSGIMPWPRALDGLREIGYRGDLSFETFNGLTQYPDPLAPQALRLAAQTADYFRSEILGETSMGESTD